MEEKSLFIEFMGDSPTIRILDYLLIERELDFSLTDLAKNAGIGRATLYRLLDDLIESKIIIYTRDIGKSRLFKLNEKNDKIKKLIEIYDMLTLEELRKHTRREIEVIA